MRPWLLLPVLLPGLWAGVTYAELWPVDAPGWLADPLTGASLAVTGIVVAWFAEQLRNGPRSLRRRSWLARLLDEPARE